MTDAQRCVLRLLAPGELPARELWERLGASGFVTDGLTFWFLMDDLDRLGLAQKVPVGGAPPAWRLTAAGRAEALRQQQGGGAVSLE